MTVPPSAQPPHPPSHGRAPIPRPAPLVEQDMVDTGSLAAGPLSRPAPGATPARVWRRLPGWLPWLVAGVGLAVGICSGAVAIYAVRQLGIAPAGTAPVPGPATTASQAAADRPVDAAAVFAPAFASQEFRLEPGCGSGEASFLDVDEPRAGGYDSVPWDVSLSSCQNVTHVDFNSGVTASTAGDATVTPEGCADLVRRAPVNPTQDTVAVPGLVLCVVTSPSAAAHRGIPRRIAVVQVRAMAADDTVNLLVTAWNVPH